MRAQEKEKAATSCTCAHCLLSFPARDAIHQAVAGQERVFCCEGCLAVFALIHIEGLDAFYEKRQWSEVGPSAAAANPAFEMESFTEQVVDRGNRREVTLFLEGIRCASCVWLNERILARTEGVEYARVNYATHMAKIRWDPAVVSIEAIIGRIASIGYVPRPYSESERFRLQKAEERDLLVRFGTAAFLSSQLMVYSIALYAGYFQGIDKVDRLLIEGIAMFLTIPVVFYAGLPFLEGTFRGLTGLHFTMDSLIAIGALSAFGYSLYQMATGGEVFFDTAAMIITLILLGRYIETAAKGRASEAITKLSRLMPREARVLRGGGPEAADHEVATVAVTALKGGDLIQVRPGERIPLDGVVIAGHSEVDESPITGESRPVLKEPGKEVIGGCLNLFGALTVEVRKTHGEGVLSHIIRAVEDAQANKPAIQTFADRAVGVFVPAVMLIASLTVAFYLLRGMPAGKALMTGVSVLVIACPCSLGLATPLAILIGSTMASAGGILIRSGAVLEKIKDATHVFLDKTGTVTAGRPSLQEIIVTDPTLTREDLLYLAASLEGLSEHSVGRAIREAAGPGMKPAAVSGFRAVPGKGVAGTIGMREIFIGNRPFMEEKGVGEGLRQVEGTGTYERCGDTVVYAGWEGMVKGVFVISDALREEARAVIGRLRAEGLHVAMVSGDTRATTEATAAAAGIADAISEASPVKKREIIAQVQKQGQRVIMVGDGINDAPALTEAAVGIAMGRGTEIAMESADAVLIRNDLRTLPYLIELSKKTFGIIQQNVFWAFFYNVAAIPLAVSGLLHPIVAAGAMAASSLIVVGNSLRIRKCGQYPC